MQPHGITNSKDNEEKKNELKQYSNDDSSKIDIEKIIAENSSQTVKEEIEKEEMQLEYITKYIQDKDLPKGMIQVEQDGKNGMQEISLKRTYIDGELSKEEVVDTKVKKSSVNKIVKIGAAEYTSNYKMKIGDNLYTTPENTGIYLEANQDSTKLITIQKGTEVKLIEIQDEWCAISYQKYKGWIKKDNLTYLSQTRLEEIKAGIKSKEELLKSLKFEMDLNKPSGLSLEQFKKVLSNNSEDKNNVFANNAQYFYYVEQQYKVNGVFIAAIGIHESGWGTSAISKDKKNLFGYGAYDRSPYSSSYDFKDYNEGIDLIARVLKKYYLNPKGTVVFDEQVATGTSYNGPTLSGVNKKYATDKNWANSVYKWMAYLYNRI